LVLALCVSLVFAHGDHGTEDHDHEHGSHVLVLGKDNFDTEIAAHDLVLVEFYAPWCGHCKKLAPEYEKAAHDLEGKAVLAKVDCTAEAATCSKFDVKGYPSIKVFRKEGTHSEYPAGRTASDIVKFMSKQNAPAYVELSDETAVDAFLSGKEVAVAGFFDSLDDAPAQAFIKVAKALRNDYNFAVVTTNAASLAAKHGDAQLPAVVVGKPFDGEDDAVFAGDFAADALTSFIKAEAFPLVGKIGPENYQKYVERSLPLVWLFVDPNAAATKDVLATARTVAAGVKGKVSVVNLDGVRWADHAKNFGVKWKPPGCVIEDRDKGKNFVFPENSEFSADVLSNFVNSYLDGSLKANLKSQEIPADNSGPVKVLVGKNFDAIVLDETKDVLVEFYAPWCGHCKSLAPKYDKLGEMMASETSIVIAKVDSTENDTPPTKVKGFPTLILFPQGSKASPITYSGERTEDALSKWLYEKAPTLKGKSAAAVSDDKDEL